MSKNEMSSAIQIAQKLVNHLPKDMADQLKEIIRRARNEDEAAIENEINNLLYPHENIRRWMREQISLQDEASGSTRGYGALAGDPSVPASQKWVCPNDRCTESLPVIQENEDAPKCSIHKLIMKRAEKKKG